MKIKKAINVLILIGIFAFLTVSGALSQTKIVPPSRPVEISPDRAEQITRKADQESQQPLLPKIDLPEFVITGVARFEPPDVEKMTFEESGIYRRGQGLHTVGTRDIATQELGERYREKFFRPKEHSFTGKVLVGYGSYSSPWGEFWLGKKLPTFDYAVDAYYNRTKGFQSYTDRSSGGIGALGNTMFTSSSAWLDQSRLAGRARYQSEKYRFYGSVVPTVTRTISQIDFGTTFRSIYLSPIRYQALLNYRNTTVEDSSERARENKISVGLRGEIPIWKTSVQTGLNYTIATVGSLQDYTVSLFESYVGSSKIWWGGFFIQAGVHFYASRDMEDQKKSRVFPKAKAGYWFLEKHTATLSYAPSIGFASMDDRIHKHPFLSAQSFLKHPETIFSLESVLESDWNEWLSTKIGLKFDRIVDYPHYVDSAQIGIWRIGYFGRTNLLKANIEAFANLSPNDYFGVAVVGNLPKNALTKNRVPYMPEADLSAFYSHYFSFGLSVHPRIEYYHFRPVAVDSSNRLPGFMLANLELEYVGLKPFSIFLRLGNILNKRYEVWHGYRGLPFTANFGLSFRW